MTKITLSDGWFDAKGKMNDEEPATPREVQVLKEFLSGHITCSVAAKGLMTVSEDDKPLIDKLNRVAWLLMDTIIHYQTQQPLLIELLDAIHHLSDSELDFSTQQKERYPDWPKWKELGRFELLLDETLRSLLAYRYSPDDEDEDPHDSCRRWESINSFLAHRCIYNKGRDGCVFGIRLIASTLAQESWSNDGEGRVNSVVLDADIPAAAQWLLIAGDMIYSDLMMRPDPKLSGLYEARNIKLDKRQWDSWKASLHSVGQQHALHSKTKILAKQTLNKMENIEAKNAENDTGFADEGTRILQT